MALSSPFAMSLQRSQIKMPHQDSSPEPSESRFFTTLAGELRNAIYDLCVQDETELPSQNGLEIRLLKGSAPNLQLVSRRFKDEYLDRVSKVCTLSFYDCHLFGFQTVRFPDISLYHEFLWDLQLPIPQRPSPSQLAEVNYRKGMAMVENIRSLEFTLVLECQDMVHTSPHLCPHDTGCEAEMSKHIKWIENFTEPPKHKALLGPGMKTSELPDSPRLPNLRSVTLNLLLDPHSKVAECESVLLKKHSKMTKLKNMQAINVYHSSFVQPAQHPRFPPLGAASVTVPIGIRNPNNDTVWDLRQKKTKIMGWSRPNKKSEDKGLQRVDLEGKEGSKEKNKDEDGEDDDSDSLSDSETVVDGVE